MTLAVSAEIITHVEYDPQLDRAVENRRRVDAAADVRHGGLT